MNPVARNRHEGRAWHLNDLLAIELFVAVVTIGLLATIATATYWNDVLRADISEAWTFLRPMTILWVEEHAVSGEVSSDAIGYLRARSASLATESAESPAAALGSIRGLEALRSRALVREVSAEPSSKAEAKSRLQSVGISDGVPIAVVKRRYLPAPMIFELRPAQLFDDAPLVSWICGANAAPSGWSAPPAREPQIPDVYLPSICRQRKAP